MAAHFKTQGPFELSRTGGLIDEYALDELWRAEPELKDAIGIYIVAVKSGTKLVPWYVGKSDRGFASRLKHHAIFLKLAHRVPKGNLYIFLIARVTTKEGRYKKAAPKLSQLNRAALQKLPSISRLEFMLIGTCLALNPELLNDQIKKFHEQLVVPGYLPLTGGNFDASAKVLAEMLEPGSRFKESR